MKVWIAESGPCTNQGIIGVYTSPQAAQTAHPVDPGKEWPPHCWKWNQSRGVWTNGLEGDFLIELREWEVEGPAE